MFELKRYLRSALIALACFSQLYLWSAAASAEIGVVQVEGGLVKGVPSDTAGVQLFKGIPYAGYVGGENRWKPAPAVEPWDGVRVADTWGDRVLQDVRGSNTPPVSENGLNLNIFTPATSSNDNLPVYMLIHGGGNSGGSNTMTDLYAAELAAKGLIVVSVNYRTGPFGFLALPEMAEESPQDSAGNYGVLDLVTALHWIQNNIAGFGGDPDTVTFGGQSAGGENSIALLRTPLARGLFTRAFISSSFAGFLPGKVAMQDEKMLQNRQAINEIFGRSMSLADLRAVPAEEFIAPREGKPSLFRELHGATVSSQFYTVDDYVFTEESIDLLRPGALNGIDLMIGQAADEYTGLGGNERGTMTPEEFAEAIMEPINYGIWGNVGEEALERYRPETELDAYRLFLRSKSDRLFQGVKLSSEYVDTHNEDAPVYLFYWDHAPPGRNEGFRGAYHAADIPFFNASMRDVESQRRWTDPDYRMKELASSYLANFIKTGNPNGPGLPEWGRVAENDEGQFMRFHEGRGELVTETVYPSRDQYHRKIILEANGFTEASLRGN